MLLRSSLITQSLSEERKEKNSEVNAVPDEEHVVEEEGLIEDGRMITKIVGTEAVHNAVITMKKTIIEMITMKSADLLAAEEEEEEVKKELLVVGATVESEMIMGTEEIVENDVSVVNEEREENAERGESDVSEENEGREEREESGGDTERIGEGVENGDIEASREEDFVGEVEEAVAAVMEKKTLINLTSNP